MATIAECVGGHADGVQLDPHDASEPDDWPDLVPMENKETGEVANYWLRQGRPKIKGGFRVYFYDLETDD